MNVTLVRGIGKCIECGNMTSTQLWLGKMQFYYCNKCIEELYLQSHSFLYKNNEYFKIKELENKAKDLVKASERFYETKEE